MKTELRAASCARDLADRYGDQMVPRYTSYPTAPHFHTLASTTYRGWLANLPFSLPLSLYVHVPFCHQLCWYCGCATTVTTNEQRIDAYAKLLAREISLTADAMREIPTVSHVHLGGGTPSALGEAGLIQLFDTLRAQFPIPRDAELAIELDPRVVTEETIDALAAVGINRASLGVQSFDPAVQKSINRVQSFDSTAEAVRSLRAVGIDRINLDLLYGLPYQTVENCKSTVKQALQLEPDRVSVFGYAHVPHMRPHQSLLPEEALPDTTERAAQFQAIADGLTDAGLIRIGLDHFARADDSMAIAVQDGTLHRNFQGYTTDDAAVLLGFGSTSIGSLPQGYVQNHAHMSDYRNAIEAGELPVARGRPLTADDRARRSVIERIMCDGRVDLAAIAAEHDLRTEDLAPDEARLEELAACGVVHRNGQHLEVPAEHWSLLRVVAASFDRYLSDTTARHSRAV